MYRVEVFTNNNWVILSRHKNKEYAIINADVVHKNRRCDVRVIFNGSIIYQLIM